MRKLDLLQVGIGLLVLIFSFSLREVNAQTTPQSPVPLPVPFTPIVDNANVIDAATRQRLESIYLNLKERGNIEYAVLTVDTTGDLDIFDFSLRVARGWGIGPKDGEKASFLLVVAIKDRKYFTQVSRHLEGDLPDGLVGQIQRERLVPAFRQQNYSKGILDTIQTYVATLAEKRGFNIEGIDQRLAYRERPPDTGERDQKGFSSICFGLLFLLFIVVLLSSASRRGGGGGGCLRTLLWGMLFSNLGGGRRSSGWGGGGFGGGGFGGGGGGFGGGFGGGGDFGGGGSGGSW
ncbi:MAG TPA: TPM domain-containing protein [Pyrinomonadaceae bacterium]|nr:TPM domain-containing protein [Pyrinomonadaceae bacterium]